MNNDAGILLSMPSGKAPASSHTVASWWWGCSIPKASFLNPNPQPRAQNPAHLYHEVHQLDNCDPHMASVVIK